MKVDQQAMIVAKMMKLSHTLAKLSVHETDPDMAAYLKCIASQMTAHTKDLIELPCGSRNSAKF
jgi:hypothetical protein